jgi:hypothetical protein
MVSSDLPALAWPESPGSGFVKSQAGPSVPAPAWPGLALAQALAFYK